MQVDIPVEEVYIPPPHGEHTVAPDNDENVPFHKEKKKAKSKKAKRKKAKRRTVVFSSTIKLTVSYSGIPAEQRAQDDEP